MIDRRMRQVRDGLLAFLLACGTAHADDVTDQLDKAAAAYREQDFAAALAAVDTAAALLRQQRSEAWKSLLPPPLPGWTAGEVATNSVSPVVLGGVASVSRSYRQAGGQVDITILADSPVLQGIGAAISSLLSLGAGGRTVVINGRRLTYLQDENAYTAMVGDKAMVKVSATTSTPEEALRRYVAAIDFGAIERLTR